MIRFRLSIIIASSVIGIQTTAIYSWFIPVLESFTPAPPITTFTTKRQPHGGNDSSFGRDTTTRNVVIRSTQLYNNHNLDDVDRNDNKDPCCQSLAVGTTRTSSRRRFFVWSRRQMAWLSTVYGASSGVVFLVLQPPEAANAIQAVGSGELACREAGNCLEKGELDGALGWSWGGKNRCDATDPNCGVNGQTTTTTTTAPSSSSSLSSSLKKRPPAVIDPNRITHVAVLRIEIGRPDTTKNENNNNYNDANNNVLRLGLYGNEAPIEQILDFWSATGLTTLSRSTAGAAAQLEKGAIGQYVTAPVSLTRGGRVTWVTPGQGIEFGVPSQAVAYAKSIGRGGTKVLDSFIAQPRPDPLQTYTTTPLRHKAAGLVSIPKKGLGYGGTGYESNDECFERSFLITNVDADDANKNSVSAIWDQTRLVVGQVLEDDDDDNSMAFLDRLCNLPTNRGSFRGILPGQIDGPPLPRVLVRDVTVMAVPPGKSPSRGSDSSVVVVS